MIREMLFTWEGVVKPTIMKNRFIFMCLIIGSLILWHRALAFENYREIQHQERQLAHLNVSQIDLPIIINAVDAIGGDIQLNWKEIMAIVAIKQENILHSISETTLTKVAESFIDQNSILSFEEVLALHFNDEESIKRAHQYLDELTFVGYVPEKLKPETMEAQFIAKLKDIAKKNFEETGILPSIVIAQAILESNWGQSELAVIANNLFGIKADSYWDGTIATFNTFEYSGALQEAQFRKYEDWYNSIADHTEFLLANPRYTEAGLFDATTYRGQSQALQDAGYSTAVDEYGNLVYARRLQELIRQYNLQLLDHYVLSAN